MYTVVTYGRVYRSNGPTDGVISVMRGLKASDLRQWKEEEGRRDIVYREIDPKSPKARVSRSCRMYGEYVGFLPNVIGSLE